MLLVAAEACRLLRRAEHLPGRRPVLVVYELLRIAADPLELLLLVFEQEVAYAATGFERPLELRVLLDPLLQLLLGLLLCLFLCIVDGGLWPVKVAAGSATCRGHDLHGAAWVAKQCREKAGGDLGWNGNCGPVG